MAKLPVVSGNNLVAALKKAGFQVVRQRGSHVSLQKGPCRTIVPLHEELARGTLLGILKQCRLSKQELIALINK